MKRIAYVANSFPEAGEWYVWEEIRELRKQGCGVIPCSFRRPRAVPAGVAELFHETLYILPLQWASVLRACVLLIAKIRAIVDLLSRAMSGPEALPKRARTLAHTFLGACLAAALHEKKVDHIHVHHGYFSAWAVMVAARLFGVEFSVTLHGSDLLVRGDYIECKLKNCKFCIAVSEYNQNYIRRNFPSVDPDKILVHRIGVDLDFWEPRPHYTRGSALVILSVGRLHPIKNHEFLILGCKALKSAGVQFRCVIAGDGEQHARLQRLIEALGLRHEMALQGHVRREQLAKLYGEADVVVFTSHSEGIPIAAMEAMAMQCVVLAPAITGIPELIIPGKTGFLYKADSMEDFLANLEHIRAKPSSLFELRRAARMHVASDFNMNRNMERMICDFLERIDSPAWAEELNHACPLLQQI